jgi:hypothetical protein
MTERFIGNEERDSKIPADVVEIIDAVRNNITNLEKIYEVDDLIFGAATDLKKTYGSAVKHSYAWHKLVGSSVEGNDQDVDPDVVREIDDAVVAFVRTTLQSYVTNDSSTRS